MNTVRSLMSRCPYGKRLLFNKFVTHCQNFEFSYVSNQRNVGILGVPFSKGQRKPGTDKGPNAMRAANLIPELKNLGIDVKDYGDVPCELNIIKESDVLKKADAIGPFFKKVSESVTQILSDGRTCVTLGGDHSIGMATIYGHAQAYDNTSVVWIDAHADINTIKSSASGNLHGMPVSFIVKEMQKYGSPVPGLDFMKPCINAANLVFIGLRDVDPMERVYMDDLNILNFSMREIDELGIFRVIEQTLDKIHKTGKPSVHVSFDIDAVDKLYAPSTGTPVLGGLSVREALCIAEEFSKLENLRGIDMVEVNPDLGTPEDAQRTAKVASDIITSFFGKRRRGNSPPHGVDTPFKP